MGTKISGLPEPVALADDDLIPGVDVSNTTQAPTGTTSAWPASTIADYVAGRALPFLVIGPSGGDDTAFLQAASDSVADGGWLWLRDGTYETTGTWTLGAINVVMSLNSVIEYTGSGVAVEVDSPLLASVDMTLRVRRSTVGWDDGADTTSRGIVIKNTNFSRFRLISSQFHEGVVLQGDAEGTCYNDIECVHVTNNKRNLIFESLNVGWANQNVIRGRLRLDSGWTSYTGTVLLDMSDAGNGNTFIGLSLEGNLQAITWTVLGSYNLFLNCRYEAVPAGSCIFLSASSQNLVIGGYENFGTGSIFNDSGIGNNNIGSLGMDLAVGTGSGSPDGFRLRASSTSQILSTWASGSLGAVTAAEINALGQMFWYGPTGKEGDATVLVQVDPSIRGLKFGIAGTADVGRIYCYNSTALGFKGHLYAQTDATYDIGVGGARPRDVTMSRNANVGGAVNIQGTASTGYLSFVEQSVDPGAPAADGARLFVKDNGAGKTKLCIRFASGAVVDIPGAVEP